MLKYLSSNKRQEQCFPYWLFIDSLSFAPGEADRTARKLRGEERAHAEAMFEGLRGRFEKAKELYETTPRDSRLRICALNSAAFASVFVGDYELFDEIYRELGKLRLGAKDAVSEVILDLSTRMILATMRVPVQTFSIEKLPKLPSGTLTNVFLANSYVDTFMSKNYENYAKAAGNFEMLIAYQDSERCTLGDIYLRLVCGTCFGMTGQDEKARYFFEKALDLALPEIGRAQHSAYRSIILPKMWRMG